MDAGIDKIYSLSLDADLPIELFLRLDIEKYLDQHDRAASRVAGGHSNFRQLDKIFPKQRQDTRQPGDALNNNAKFSQHEIQAVLKLQKFKSETGSITGEFALGNILIANGYITRPQLENALQQQVKTGRQLGEELITAGHASRGQVESGLLLQHKLTAYALAVTIALSQLVATSAEAAQVSTAMAVSVTVVAHAKMQTNFQMTQLKISKSDIARGYVDVPSASRFSVVSNSRSGYLLELDPVGNVFDSVQVNGLGAPVRLGADGGVIVQRGQSTTNFSHELSYRFALRPDAMAGYYPWPLQLSVHAL